MFPDTIINSPIYTIVDAMFIIVPVLFVAVLVLIIIKKVGQWNKNNGSPRLNVSAQVVTKRSSVSVSHGAGNTGFAHTNTSYYATFQVESGDRIELALTGEEYGILAEGDMGKLDFQGTRFKGFVRG